MRVPECPAASAPKGSSRNPLWPSSPPLQNDEGYSSGPQQKLMRVPQESVERRGGHSSIVQMKN